jgi:hypothetical protein
VTSPTGCVAPLDSIGRSGFFCVQSADLGAHGAPDGLKPNKSTTVTLTWNRLAATLGSATAPLWVCLGACDSEFAASAWAKEPIDFPVSILFGFKSSETSEEEIEDILLKLLDVSGVYTAGSVEVREEREEITTIEEDVKVLQPLSDRLVIYRRDRCSALYEVVPEASPESDSSGLDVSGLEIRSDAIEDFLGDDADEGGFNGDDS